MNPALYDYLQNQQNSQAQNPAPQEGYNPFNAGIRNAIQSARQSLEMTDKQQDKALRQSMLAFAEHMGNEPRQKGFLANFGAAARSLAPALTTYDDEEAAALQENNAFANQLLAHQAAEQQRQALEEQRNWQRDFSERQLGESTRSHNLLDGFRRDQLDQTKALQEQKNVQEANKHDDKFWQTRATYNTSKLIPKISDQYVKNEELIPAITEFKTLLGRTKLSGSSKMAELKRFVAKSTGTDEDVLTAKNLGQYFLEWVNQNSKGNQSDKDMKEWLAGRVDIEKNPTAGIKILNRLENNLNNQQTQYSKQLKLYETDGGANLNSLDLLRKRQEAAPAQNNSSPPSSPAGQVQKVKMRAPDGSEAWVLPEEVAAKQAMGIVLVDE